MHITDHVRADLEQLKNSIIKLTVNQFSQSLNLLSGASIGAHVRHILEFYICLLRAKNQMVSYDVRERNRKLETDLSYALYVIDELNVKIKSLTQDYALTLHSTLSINSDEPDSFSTTFYRELVYCLEHSIHHQALIKIGFKELKEESMIAENFGVAPSTIRFNHKEGITN
ncbi:MAG: hypothetical protein KF775_12740 [Cyclobacteriaceae bacterium]|nr:hypothetical protein [Cyclobacteriaceae bacterium]